MPATSERVLATGALLASSAVGFTHGGRLVVDKGDGEPLMDRDGKAIHRWPGKDAQDAAAVRCIVAGELRACAPP